MFNTKEYNSYEIGSTADPRSCTCTTPIHSPLIVCFFSNGFKSCLQKYINNYKSEIKAIIHLQNRLKKWSDLFVGLCFPYNYN